MDLTDLFSAPYQFRLGLRRGDPTAFFARSLEAERVLAERRQWLTGNANPYLAVLPEGAPLVEETLALFGEWGITRPALSGSNALEQLRWLSLLVEPDLVLLAPTAAGEMRIVAGALCFPTAWRLTDKLGRTMDLVHAPVPGLNAQLGTQIGAALSRLRSGTAWLRSNWSLTASDELNQHPDRHLPRLTAQANLSTTWLRLERQALFALPKTGGVLFAIRIEAERLDSIKERAPEAAAALAVALQTMPEVVAAYKGLAAARPALQRELVGEQ